MAPPVVIGPPHRLARQPRRQPGSYIKHPVGPVRRYVGIPPVGPRGGLARFLRSVMSPNMLQLDAARLFPILATRLVLHSAVKQSWIDTTERPPSRRNCKNNGLGLISTEGHNYACPARVGRMMPLGTTPAMRGCGTTARLNIRCGAERPKGSLDHTFASSRAALRPRHWQLPSGQQFIRSWTARSGYSCHGYDRPTCFPRATPASPLLSSPHPQVRPAKWSLGKRDEPVVQAKIGGANAVSCGDARMGMVACADNNGAPVPPAPPRERLRPRRHRASKALCGGTRAAA